MSEYRPRLLDSRLTELLTELPAIALSGPKGVGKTSTARQHAVTEFVLDDIFVREATESEPIRLRDAAPPVLLDEWQRLPHLWDLVRRWVDDGAPPGNFLLTGSAYPRGAAIHSGAGRIVSLRMRPLSLAERNLEQPTVSLGALLNGSAGVEGATGVGLTQYVHEVTASGFPQIHGLAPRPQRMRLDGYLDSVIHREFPEQGLLVRAPDTLRRWLCSYAAATGTTSTYTTILDGATLGESHKPAKATTIAYRDVLASLWLLDPVSAWTPPIPALGRLGQMPKHFLADPALAARLLDLDGEVLLDGTAERDPRVRRMGTEYGSLLGRLFEALVALSLHTYAEHVDASLRHLRTRNGDHEVDFVVQRRSSVVAIEVKLSGSVTDRDVRHLRWLKERLGEHLTDAAVITTGPSAYRRPDGIAVIPAALLGP